MIFIEREGTDFTPPFVKTCLFSDELEEADQYIKTDDIERAETLVKNEEPEDLNGDWISWANYRWYKASQNTRQNVE